MGRKIWGEHEKLSIKIQYLKKNLSAPKGNYEGCKNPSASLKKLNYLNDLPVRRMGKMRFLVPSLKAF